jgi:hypothetical protein
MCVLSMAFFETKYTFRLLTIVPTLLDLSPPTHVQYIPSTFEVDMLHLILNCFMVALFFITSATNKNLRIYI